MERLCMLLIAALVTCLLLILITHRLKRRTDGVIKVVRDEQDGSTYLFLELAIPVEVLADRKEAHFRIQIEPPQK